MFGIILFILDIVLFDPVYFALFDSENSSNRCDEVRYCNKAIDRVGVYCVDCLFIFGGCILAKSSYPSFILCNV